MALQRGLAMCDALIGNGQPAESLFLAAPSSVYPAAMRLSGRCASRSR